MSHLLFFITNPSLSNLGLLLPLSWDGSPKGLGGFQIHWPFLFSYPVLISATSDTLDHLLSAEILFLEVLDSFIWPFTSLPRLFLLFCSLNELPPRVLHDPHLSYSFVLSFGELISTLSPFGKWFQKLCFQCWPLSCFSTWIPNCLQHTSTLQNNLNFKIKA